MDHDALGLADGVLVQAKMVHETRWVTQRIADPFDICTITSFETHGDILGR
jgi:hypothetical protein